MKKNKQSQQNIPIKSASPQLKPVVPPPKREQDFFSEKLAGRDLYVLLGAIAISCFFVFRDYITLDKVYLFKDIGSDSLNIYLPGVAQFSDYIKAYGVPKWSFQQGLGQNIFPLWLGDVFSNFLELFSKEKIPYLIAYMEIIKVFLCGFVFYKYLTELKLNRYTRCILSYLFAFSGYVILGGGWEIFSTEALYVAIILYGFERWLNHGKFLWLTLGITLMSLLQPFFLYPYTIFLSIYVPVRYNDVYPAEWRKFPLFILKTLGLCVIGVAMSAYQLLPDLLQYIESPRGGEAGLTKVLKSQPIFAITDEGLRFTTTFRAFGSDMLGSGSEFMGWQNYLEAPLFYCGNLCLILFSQIFTGLNKRQKVAYGIFAGLFILPILFPFFRYTFWAYAGDYFRTFSLVITLLLILFSAKALNNIINTGKLNLVVLGVTIAALLLLLYTPKEDFKVAINTGLRSFATMLIFVYALLLFGMTKKGAIRTYCLIGLAVIVFSEMVYFSCQTVNERDVVTGADLKEKIGYNDYTIDAVKYLKENDKSFYRINKDYSSGVAIHTSVNDAKVQGYFGSPSYASFNQNNYIKFLGALDILDTKNEIATRWAWGVAKRPLLFSLVDGKYWLIRNPTSTPAMYGYDSIAKFGDVKVYRNRFSLPLAFAYDTVLDEQSFLTLSTFQKDIYLQRGCVVANSDADLLSYCKPFNLADTVAPFSLLQYARYVEPLRKNGLNLTHFAESDLSGTVSLSTPGILFFSIPFDEGWKGYVNGKEVKLYKVNFGFIGLKLAQGTSEVRLQFEPRLMKQGGMVSILSILIFIGVLAAGKFVGKKDNKL